MSKDPYNKVKSMLMGTMLQDAKLAKCHYILSGGSPDHSLSNVLETVGTT